MLVNYSMTFQHILKTNRNNAGDITTGDNIHTRRNLSMRSSIVTYFLWMLNSFARITVLDCCPSKHYFIKFFFLNIKRPYYIFYIITRHYEKRKFRFPPLNLKAHFKNG